MTESTLQDRLKKMADEEEAFFARRKAKQEKAVQARPAVKLLGQGLVAVFGLTLGVAIYMCTKLHLTLTTDDTYYYTTFWLTLAGHFVLLFLAVMGLVAIVRLPLLSVLSVMTWVGYLSLGFTQGFLVIGFGA